MRLEILGAIFAMIAPFIFHYLLQTGLSMRDIVLIMIGISLLSIIPAMDFTALNGLISHLSLNLLVKCTLIITVIILAVWQYSHWQRRKKN